MSESYALQLEVKMSRYGSLININPSARIFNQQPNGIFFMRRDGKFSVLYVFWPFLYLPSPPYLF